MLQAGFVNAKRIWEVLTYNDPMEEPETSTSIYWDSDITFDNVTFVYPGTTKPVLRNVSFNVPQGSRVAIIGGPGSGKSTVLKLLLRLYDVQEGEIRIGETPIHTVRTKDVRDKVTLVEQDIFLFSDTIKNNIAYSKPTASDEEVTLAAERAQIASFIESLPQKYETVIGERGVTLSGGQRQRVAIARALISDPKVLLLDDSTSAVDIKTELRIRYATEALMESRTSIVVTQRLTTLVAADMIILLKKGEIIDIGTHNELIERCSDYQFMCQYLPVQSSDTLDKGVSQEGVGN